MKQVGNLALLRRTSRTDDDDDDDDDNGGGVDEVRTMMLSAREL